MEFLSLLLNANKDIKGIRIADVINKLSQFADDATLLLDGSEKSFSGTLKTYIRMPQCQY